jgi:hypothetical protein
MKRLFVLTLWLACTSSLLVTSIAFAQEAEANPKPVKVADLFNWATSTPPDWARGGLYAGLGLIGALVTSFSLIGGAVPGTAGQAKIDADTARLERLSERLEKLITSTDGPPAAEAIVAVESTVNSLRDDLRAERWRQWGIAIVLYAVLGAFFAALLAKDMLQALVMGAGWTGMLGSLGLKRDYAERKDLKDTALEKTLARAEKAEELVKGTGDGSLIRALSTEPLERDVRIAKAV